MSRADSTAKTDLSYAAFGSQLYRSAFATRQPLAGSLALTHRCNLSCVHCYLAEERSVPERPTEFWLGLLDQLQQAGCLWLTLTGGEPLLRPDFSEIYAGAKRRGMLVSVFTNGTLLDEQQLALFTELPPFVVEVSLYGSSQATCAAVTGRPTAFEETQSAVRRLVQANVPVQVKTVVLRNNAHELQAMRRFADELGVGFRFDTLVTPCLNGNRNPCTTRLSDEVSLQLDLEDAERRAAWTDCLANRASLPRSKMFDCGAGQTSFHVSPDGKLALCLSDLPVYDLADGSFEQAWNGPIRERRETPLPAKHPCAGCTDLVFCGLCPPLARMETGSDLGVPARLCALGKRRRRAIAEAS